MNRKQKIIVSITGITVVMLALLGLTYGYYLTNIYGNTNSNSISITTSDLKLTYKDGTGELIASGVMPGKEITSKTFTVENDGTNDIEAYTVALINIMNNFTFKDDLEVSISCSSNINNGKCDGFAEEYVNNIYKEKYPAVNSELFSLGIKKDEIHTYTLTVDYLYQEFDQSDDMGKTLKGKVQIFDPKDTIEVSGEVIGASEGDYAEIHSDIQTSEIVDGKYKFIGIPADNHEVFIKNRETGTEKSTTLEIKKGQSESTTNNIITFIDTSKVANVTIDATKTNLSATVNDIGSGVKILVDTIMNDERITKNTGTPDFTKIADYKTTGDATSGEIGMYSAEDDYGTSWYFRGAQSYNYVYFAGFTWRIVRINGDNSIRLILDGTLDTINGCDDSNSETKFCSNYGFSSSEEFEKVGYMHGAVLDYTNLNFDYDIHYNNSVDSKAKTNVEAFYEYHLLEYQNYFEDTLFCGNKLIESTSRISSPNGMIIDIMFYYTPGDKRAVSLKCADVSDAKYTDEQKAYSRYTSKLNMNTTTSKGVLINNDLKYPIALLSVDEAIMAGLVLNISVESNYLVTPNDTYAVTMSPYTMEYGYMYHINSNDYYPYLQLMDDSTSYGEYRPVINLRSDVLVDTGNGTYDRPYTVKLPN